MMTLPATVTQQMGLPGSFYCRDHPAAPQYRAVTQHPHWAQKGTKAGKIQDMLGFHCDLKVAHTRIAPLLAQRPGHHRTEAKTASTSEKAAYGYRISEQFPVPRPIVPGGARQRLSRMRGLAPSLQCQKCGNHRTNRVSPKATKFGQWPLNPEHPDRDDGSEHGQA